MNKKKMIFVVIFILICFFQIKAWGIDFKPSSEPDGFRGIKWGTYITTLKDMEHIRTDKGSETIEVYKRKNDVLKIGGATLDNIEYWFWNKKFYIASLRAQGISNWVGLKEAVFEKFGKGWKHNEFMEEYFWSGKITKMLMTYNEISKIGQLNFTSTLILNELNLIDKQKAREGAERGF
jgi:hypothetical protein